MPSQTPSREFVPITFGGPLNQSQTPSAVASDGMTACNNVIYRRFGAWGKRPGTTTAYTLPGGGPFPGAPVSGTRFYQAYYNGAPRQLTQTVIAAEGALWVAGDPGSTPTRLLNFTAANVQPVDFCVARDPAASAGNGSDVLIIVGGSLAGGSFATAQFDFFGNPVAGQVVTLTLTPTVGSAVTVTYTTLATDTQDSVAQQMASLFNISAAVLAGTPFVAQTFAASAGTLSGQHSFVQVGALVGGSSGNGIGISGSITMGGAGVRLVITAPGTGPGATNLAGGGQTLYGPLKYDGTSITGLSPFIPNAFTGCVNWHNHVWYWGDPTAPITAFASDINEPEGFSFMATEGGYDIGDGTGAQAVTAMVPAGNILYAFNTGSSYAITGYDFQTGEYQFAIAPAIADSGVAYKECVTTLRNALIYWDGTQFQKLVPGSFETERLGAPITFSQGLVTTGSQSVIRAVAGKFVVQSTFGFTYFGSGRASTPTIFSNVALFAVAEGGSSATTTLVYDEEASRLMGFPAWMRWTGWNVGAWLTFGSGHDAAGTADDTPTLFYLPPDAPSVIEVGGSATADIGAQIAWSAQTGWFDLGDPQRPKLLHRIFLNVEARAGANLMGTIVAAGPFDGTQVITYAPITIVWPTTVGQQGNETAQELIATINPALRGYRFLLELYDGGSTVAYEITGAKCDVTLEAITPG